MASKIIKHSLFIIIPLIKHREQRHALNQPITTQLCVTCFVFKDEIENDSNNRKNNRMLSSATREQKQKHPIGSANP